MKKMKRVIATAMAIAMAMSVNIATATAVYAEVPYDDGWVAGSLIGF